MEEKNNYQVLLYYKYVTMEDPEQFAQDHLEFCNSLGLKGRILVASEGINGTVSGPKEQTKKYMEAMNNDPRFADMPFKIDEASGHAFKKMHVRPRPELVTLRLEDDINPHDLTGEYLEPKEFYQKMHDENTIILDARNDYEYDLGHFRGAIRPDINSFRELPEWVRENKEMLEGKQILTYCTGGIRCEKFSGWLKQEGFENVGQLHGGIATYSKDPEVQGQLWDGQMYVFDERISVPVNQTEHVVVGVDHFDGEPCERYVNCSNPDCNKQILCSEENEHKYMRGCTPECRVHERNRYVEEHNMNQDEINELLHALGEGESQAS
ncbi:rhodanese-related sulfurtransferase [Pontibacillus yanchengensis]|uniref:Rhodanese-related sulfurtransferase n=2 Tax=Pontibacillus yanchengensis TaxID=462910 RepID=A0ACC7VCU0_9BACI|nr:rhodanese-related sulfurtransferase [Pontibacillus yanchengensis]MYL35143.1 rhodanese-related sulfurtransferase [Pontibacillus yanchengensis]MYL52490.1 rhodanese-related sulfurtransferase [Pontibacillus yanchengensis]